MTTEEKKKQIKVEDYVARIQLEYAHAASRNSEIPIEQFAFDLAKSERCLTRESETVNAMISGNKMALNGLSFSIKTWLISLRIVLMRRRYDKRKLNFGSPMQHEIKRHDAEVREITKKLKSLYDLHFKLDDNGFGAATTALWDKMQTLGLFRNQARMPLTLLFDADYLLCDDVFLCLDDESTKYRRSVNLCLCLGDATSKYRCAVEQIIDREIYLLQKNKDIENKQLILDFRNALFKLCENNGYITQLHCWREEVCSLAEARATTVLESFNCKREQEIARKKVAEFEPCEVKDKEIRKEIAGLYERIKQLDQYYELVMWPLEDILSSDQLICRILLICNSMVCVLPEHYATYQRC